MGQRAVVLASLVCVIQLAGLQGTTACGPDEFECFNNDECVLISQMCDGVLDCYDGTDELIYCDCPMPFEEVSRKLGSDCVLLDVYKRSWQEARDVCRSLDADLAVLHDWNFYKELIDYLHGKDLANLNYWVGASDEVEEGVWTWVDGTPVRMGTPLWSLYYYYDHNLGHATYAQEPFYEYANGQDCGYMYGDQSNYMADRGCATKMASVCQKKKSPHNRTTTHTKDGSIRAPTTPIKALPATKPCPAPFELVGGRCLWLAMEELEWQAALYLCQRFEADLVSVNDIGFHADLVDYFEFKGVSGSSFWIGSNDTKTEGTWKWHEGQWHEGWWHNSVRMGSPLWRTTYNSSGWQQEPYFDVEEEDCGMLDHEAFHYMADAVCTRELAAVCQIPSNPWP